MTAVPAIANPPRVLADIASTKMRSLVASPAARDAILVTAGVALISLLAQVRIDVGPVPVTGQTLAVMLIGSALGARRGLLATALYVLLGVAGAPIFAGGVGGIGVVRGATFGYLLGFVAAAWLVGKFAEAGWDRGVKAVPAFLAAFALPFIPGVAWLALFFATTGVPVTAAGILGAGLAPFIPGEIIKIAIAAGISPIVWRIATRVERA